MSDQTPDERDAEHERLHNHPDFIAMADQLFASQERRSSIEGVEDQIAANRAHVGQFIDVDALIHMAEHQAQTGAQQAGPIAFMLMPILINLWTDGFVLASELFADRQAKIDAAMSELTIPNDLADLHL